MPHRAVSGADHAAGLLEDPVDTMSLSRLTGCTKAKTFERQFDDGNDISAHLDITTARSRNNVESTAEGIVVAPSLTIQKCT